MKAEDISWSNVSMKLIEFVPELRPEYEELLKRPDGYMPGPYYFYGDMLDPFLMSLLQSAGHESRLKEIFEFLEILANHPDEQIPGMVQVTVCEYLFHDLKALDRAYQLMGPTTRSFIDSIRQWDKDFDPKQGFWKLFKNVLRRTKEGTLRKTNDKRECSK